MGNGFEINRSAQPREVWFRDWYLTGLSLHVTREQMGLRTRYREDGRGQPHRARKFVSHQNSTILEKRGILAVSRQLSSKIMMRMLLLGKLTATSMLYFHFFLNMWASFPDESHLPDMQNRWPGTIVIILTAKWRSAQACYSEVSDIRCKILELTLRHRVAHDKVCTSR